MKKLLPIVLLMLVFCSCDRDFKVWKDLNTSTFTAVKNDSASYYKASPSGVLYHVIYPVYHTGYIPKPDSQVLVNYKGWLADGTQFDANDEAVFDMSSIISGLQEALCLMTDGEKWRIYVPYDLGYGSDGLEDASGNFIVPPYSTLIFEVELIEVYNN